MRRPHYSLLRIGLRPSDGIAAKTPPQNSWGQRFHTVLSSAASLILKGSGQIAKGFNLRLHAVVPMGQITMRFFIPLPIARMTVHTRLEEHFVDSVAFGLQIGDSRLTQDPTYHVSMHIR